MIFIKNYNSQYWQKKKQKKRSCRFLVFTIINIVQLYNISKLSVSLKCITNKEKLAIELRQDCKKFTVYWT